MILFLSCFSPSTSTDTAISKTVVQDTSVQCSTEEQCAAFFEPWPDTGIAQTSELSINYEGSLISNNDTISFQTPPAGLEEAKSIFVILVNHTSVEIELHQENWLVGNGFESTTILPSYLPPQESMILEITFQSQEFTEAQIHVGHIQPTSDIQISLEAIIPPPLRLLLASRQGHLWASDDYGTTFFEVPQISVGQIKSLSFGHELFVLSYANEASENSNGGILYSTDGSDWTDAIVDDITAFQDCAFGLGRFLCLRGDTLSWSVNGMEWYHEETQHDFELLDILFSKDRFVAVGKNGRRVVSWDGVSWNLENFSGQIDPYLAITEQILPNAGTDWDRRWVAIGGEHRFFASMSEDGGTSWTNIPLSTCQGDQLQSIAWFEASQKFLAQGSSTCHHNMIHSVNGLLWNPLIQTHPFDQYQILGQWRDQTYFFRSTEEGGVLYTSIDGEFFEEKFSFPTGQHVQFMAVSTWSGDEP